MKVLLTCVFFMMENGISASADGEMRFTPEAEVFLKRYSNLMQASEETLKRVFKDSPEFIDFFKKFQCEYKNNDCEIINTVARVRAAIREKSKGPLSQEDIDTLLQMGLKNWRGANVQGRRFSAINKFDFSNANTDGLKVFGDIRNSIFEQIVGFDTYGNSIIGNETRGGDISQNKTRGGSISGNNTHGGAISKNKTKNGDFFKNKTEGGCFSGNQALDGDFLQNDTEGGTFEKNITKSGFIWHNKTRGGDFVENKTTSGNIWDNETEGGKFEDNTTEEGYISGNRVQKKTDSFEKFKKFFKEIFLIN